MLIKQIEKDEFYLINEFLSSCFSSPTHWPEWNLLVSKYFNTNFYYFVITEKNELIGILPIHETVIGFIKNLKSGRYKYIPNGGWLLKKEINVTFSELPIPINSSIECFSLPLLKEFGVDYTVHEKTFTTLIIDLNSSEEDIWNNSINSKRRNMIRKALKMGVTIQNNSSCLNDFYMLYSSASKKNELICLPYDFFSELFQKSIYTHFEPLVAYFEDKPCGALGLIYDKNYSYYWLGASSLDFLNLGQGELLQWEAIKKVKAFGCNYYDLCYIEKERLPKIYDFKKGFSNNEYSIVYLKKATFSRKLLNRLNNIIKREMT